MSFLLTGWSLSSLWYYNMSCYDEEGETRAVSGAIAFRHMMAILSLLSTVSVIVNSQTSVSKDLLTQSRVLWTPYQTCTLETSGAALVFPSPRFRMFEVFSNSIPLQNFSKRTSQKKRDWTKYSSGSLQNSWFQVFLCWDFNSSNMLGWISSNKEDVQKKNTIFHDFWLHTVIVESDI